MSKMEDKTQARLKRKKRIRKKVVGTQQRPRLSVFRSAVHIYAQIIDDLQGITLVSCSTLDPSVKQQGKFESKIAAANYVGQLLAERARAAGIEQVVFDRNGFLYHGRVKAVSDGARKSGLSF